MSTKTVTVKRASLRPRQEVMHEGKDWMVGTNLPDKTYLYRAFFGAKEFAQLSGDDAELIVMKTYTDE